MLAVLSRTRERYISQRSKEIQRLLQNIGLDAQIFSINTISELKAGCNNSESSHKFRDEFPSQLFCENREIPTDGHKYTRNGHNPEANIQTSRIPKRNDITSRKAIDHEVLCRYIKCWHFCKELIILFRSWKLTFRLRGAIRFVVLRFQDELLRSLTTCPCSG